MLAFGIRQLQVGKIRSFGEVTLDDNSATTTLSDRNIHATSAVILFPTTANAATEFGAGTLHISARTDESATITHVNNAQTDRTFMYVVLGLQ